MSQVWRNEGQNLWSAQVQILNGATASDMIGMQGKALVGIELPATFTGTALTFQMSSDQTNFKAVHDNGVALSITVVQNTYVVVDPSKWFGCDSLKIISGSAEGGDRTLKVFAREVA